MISTIQKLTCDFCGSVECVEMQTHLTPYTMLTTVVPVGWAWVGNKLACKRHDIIVKDKLTKD